jgi:hypothetical protein
LLLTTWNIHNRQRLQILYQPAFTWFYSNQHGFNKWHTFIKLDLYI